MSRILCAGDVHGEHCNIASLFHLASKRNCDRIHVLGDLGVFPNLYPKFLPYCSELVSKYSIPLSFTDGNHEDYFFLNSLPETEERFVSEGVEWFWRGKVFENILSIGGAYSIDKNSRTMGIDWFPEELISTKDLYNCFEKSAMIVFSHDTPIELNLFLGKDDPETISNRKMLSSIVNSVQPKILIHGHYHRFYDTPIQMDYGICRVIGLDCGENPEDQCLILDNGEVEIL